MAVGNVAGVAAGGPKRVLSDDDPFKDGRLYINLIYRIFLRVIVNLTELDIAYI